MYRSLPGTKPTGEESNQRLTPARPERLDMEKLSPTALVTVVKK